MVDFLNRKERVVIPVGGDFQPNGFIGQWQAAVMASFMTEVNLKDEEIAFDQARQMGDSGYTRYYWHNYDAAVEAGKAVGQEYPPEKLWVFEAAVSSVIFSDESTREKFGVALTYDGCRIKTMRSKKSRHELHMIALPAAVFSYAVMKGWDVPEPPFAELLSQDTAFTDDFQAAMIGHPDKDDYEDSTLWKYRVELWKALGEPSAKAYQVFQAGTKFDASSDNQLSEALGILHYPWNQPVWARLIPIPDPRVDAVYTKGNDTRRLSIPALMAIFEDEDAAKAAAEADRVSTGGDGDGETKKAAKKAAPAVPAGGGEQPDVPETWVGYTSDWLDIMKDLKAEGPKVKTIKRLEGMSAEDLEEEIGATVDDVKAWWDHV